MLEAAVKNPDQSISERAQRLVMRLSPRTKRTVIMSGTG